MKNYLPTLEFMAGLYLGETDEKDILLSLSVVEYKLRKYMELLAGETSCENHYLLQAVKELMDTTIIPRLLPASKENYERLTCYSRINPGLGTYMTLLGKFRSYMDSHTANALREEVTGLYPEWMDGIGKSA